MKTIIIILFTFSITLVYASDVEKKLNSIECAKVLAQRNIVETVYGLKIRFSEEVSNILDGVFKGVTETKTGKRLIRGIEYDSIKYDSKKDIAQVTASLKLSKLANIVDQKQFRVDKFPDKVIRRVAFATSTPSVARKIAAIRAAEIDAYKNLYKKICGYTLESHTKVKNYVMKSDSVKAYVVGALMGAEFKGFKWSGKGDDAIVTVKLRINIKELSEMLPERIIDYDQDYAEAEGVAAQVDDYKLESNLKKRHIKKPQVLEEESEILP